MRACEKVVLCAATVLLVAACSEDDPAPAGNTLFGGAGGGGSGTGGSGGGEAGSAGSGGSAGMGGGTGGGSAGTAGGGGTAGMGGQSDAGTDAKADAPADAPIDVVANLDPCPASPLAFDSVGWVAAGSTPQAFRDAFNAEVAATDAPGPLLLRLNGVDSADPAGWTLDIGAPAAGGPPFTFDGAPASIPFDFAPGKTVVIPETDTSFTMRFGTVDIPITRVQFGSVFSPSCDQFMSEEILVVIPGTAGSTAFGGSTLDDLLGGHNCCGAAEDSWLIELTGISESVQM